MDITTLEVINKKYDSISNSDMLLELIFNKDTVLMCQYTNQDQCKSNPLLKIWQDFNKTESD